MTLVRTAVLLATLGLSSIAVAQNEPAKPPPPETTTPRPHSTGRVPQGVLDDFIAGFQGDETAFKRAMEGADKVLRDDPTNAEALAWRSSGMGMQAGKSFQKGDFREGMRLWGDSQSGLNRAVDMEPDNVHVRFVRGKSMLESSLHDPNPTSSGEEARMAIGDLELALGSIDDLEKRLPKSTREEFYAWLLQAAKKVGDKERIEKYTKLAGEKADEAAKRVEQSAAASTTGECLRQALAILDTDLAKALKADLNAGLHDPKRLDAAIAMLDELLAATPGNTPLMAWRGFARTLRAAPLFAQAKMEEGLKLWDEGLAEISKASTNDPSSHEALILRGLTTLERARFGMEEAERRPIAVKATSDLERARRLLVEAGKPLPPNPDAELSFALARGYRLAGDTAKASAALVAVDAGQADEKMKARAKVALEKLAVEKSSSEKEKAK